MSPRNPRLPCTDDEISCQRLIEKHGVALEATLNVDDREVRVFIHLNRDHTWGIGR
jgi:hypothetical protein